MWARLLQPFTPNLAEELWEAIGGNGFVSKAEWPSPSPGSERPLLQEEYVSNLLDDRDPHIVVSALNIIIAIAAAGCEEELISGGIIAELDPLQNHEDRLIRNKSREALWLLVPGEDIVTSELQDES